MRDRIARVVSAPALLTARAAAVAALLSWGGCAHTPDTLLSQSGIVDAQSLETQIHCPGGASLVFGRTLGVKSAAWCQRADSLKQGPYIDWFENHQKKSAGLYSDGRRHGTWSFWLPGGQLDSSITYDKGNVVGQAAPPATTP